MSPAIVLVSYVACAAAGGSELVYEDGLAELRRGNHSRAVSIWEDLAISGDGLAQCGLAELYLNGNVVPKDDRRAIELYEQAGSTGESCAYAPLAFAYLEGQGVQRDTERGLSWLRLGAAAGNADAQFKLGLLNLRPQFGDESDCCAARVWIEASAMQANADAEGALAGMFASGKCVEQDDAAAFAWASRSAEQGNEYAQLRLANLYATGRGVERDAVKAYMWQRISLPGSDFLGDSLSVDERRLAEKLAGEFLAKRYPDADWAEVFKQSEVGE